MIPFEIFRSDNMLMTYNKIHPFVCIKSEKHVNKRKLNYEKNNCTYEINMYHFPSM